MLYCSINMWRSCCVYTRAHVCVALLFIYSNVQRESDTLLPSGDAFQRPLNYSLTFFYSLTKTPPVGRARGGKLVVAPAGYHGCRLPRSGNAGLASIAVACATLSTAGSVALDFSAGKGIA